MAEWNYKMSRHQLNGRTVPESDQAIKCDQKGSCLAHDLRDKEMERMTEVLNAEGKGGWELVQCHYHSGDLVCLWKRQQK